MHIILNDVILRMPEPRDVKCLYSFRNNLETTRLLGGFARGYSEADLIEWVECHRSRKDEVLWVIADRQNDKCLGHAGLYQLDHRVRCAEYAILIGDQALRGKGLGGRVSRAVLQYGFEELNLNRVELSVLAVHDAALKLYEKLGFRREGVKRQAQFREGRYVDVVIMGLLAAEYCASATRNNA